MKRLLRRLEGCALGAVAAAFGAAALACVLVSALLALAGCVPGHDRKPRECRKCPCAGKGEKCESPLCRCRRPEKPPEK